MIMFFYDITEMDTSDVKIYTCNNNRKMHIKLENKVFCELKHI